MSEACWHPFTMGTVPVVTLHLPLIDSIVHRRLGLCKDMIATGGRREVLVIMPPSMHRWSLGQERETTIQGRDEAIQERERAIQEPLVVFIYIYTIIRAADEQVCQQLHLLVSEATELIFLWNTSRKETDYRQRCAGRNTVNNDNKVDANQRPEVVTSDSPMLRTSEISISRRLICHSSHPNSYRPKLRRPSFWLPPLKT